nr:copia protein [Tanacetum cinerariifolium]
DKSDNKKHDEKAKTDDKGKNHVDLPTGVRDLRDEFEEFSFNNTNRVNAVIVPVNVVGPNSTNSFNSFNTANMPELEDIVYSNDEEDVGAEADLSNLETNITLSPILNTRVFKNKKDKRGIVIRNKARLVAHVHAQEEGIDYDEVFAPVVRIEAILLFLAYASLMGFMVYQMDVKSTFLYGTIEEESDNKKHDEKAKTDDKGKNHVDLPTGVRDLRDEFEEFSFNNTNRVNAVIVPVNVVGPNSTNSSNCFNTANMPELEDIVYSNDEEDVGAEADLSNLETNITLSPILNTRVHKDHPVNQIIGDLN